MTSDCINHLNCIRTKHQISILYRWNFLRKSHSRESSDFSDKKLTVLAIFHLVPIISDKSSKYWSHLVKLFGKIVVSDEARYGNFLSCRSRNTKKQKKWNCQLAWIFPKETNTIDSSSHSFVLIFVTQVSVMLLVKVRNDCWASGTNLRRDL